jgi:hypothetical protein
VFALVDADDMPSSEEDWVLSLPAAEIENMLLVPRVLVTYLGPHEDKLPDALRPLNESTVESALRRIASENRDLETGSRLRRRLRIVFELKGKTVKELRAELESVSATAASTVLSLEEFDTLAGETERRVDDALTQKTELHAFGGKEILRKFYGRFVANCGFGSYQNFVYELARHAGRDDLARHPLADVVLNISYYIPGEITRLLGELRDPDAASALPGNCAAFVSEGVGALLKKIERATSLRKAGEPDGSLHDEIRREALDLVRQVRQKADEAETSSPYLSTLLDKLAKAAREIATGPPAL